MTHLVITARSRGWEQLANGDLLRAAEDASFKVLLTADQNLVYQQNNSNRKISLIVLSANSLERLLGYSEQIPSAIDRSCLGSYEFIAVPHASKAR
jgi:hypothetical protein